MSDAPTGATVKKETKNGSINHQRLPWKCPSNVPKSTCFSCWAVNYEPLFQYSMLKSTEHMLRIFKCSMTDCFHDFSFEVGMYITYCICIVFLYVVCRALKWVSENRAGWNCLSKCFRLSRPKCTQHLLLLLGK